MATFSLAEVYRKTREAQSLLHAENAVFLRRMVTHWQKTEEKLQGDIEDLLANLEAGGNEDLLRLSAAQIRLGIEEQVLSQQEVSIAAGNLQSAEAELRSIDRMNAQLAQATYAQQIAQARIEGYLKSITEPLKGHIQAASRRGLLDSGMVAKDAAITGIIGGGAADRAVAAMMGAMDGPLGKLLDSIPLTVSAEAHDALIQGITLGKNPRVIAKEMADKAGIAHTRALLIARTETMRAYREGQRAQWLAMGDLVKGWTWASVRDDRTCPACWAMHGSTHPISEPFFGHPNCRCTMIPIFATIPGLPTDLVPDIAEATQGSSMGGRFAEAAARERINLGVTPVRNFSARTAEEARAYNAQQAAMFAEFEADLKGMQPTLRTSGVRYATGLWEGDIEPSRSAWAEGDPDTVRLLAANLGKKYDQDAVMLWHPDRGLPTAGDEAVLVTLKGISSDQQRDRALTIMQSFHDADGNQVLPGGRFVGNDLELVLSDPTQMRTAHQLALDLGIKIERQHGSVEWIDRASYDTLISHAGRTAQGAGGLAGLGTLADAAGGNAGDRARARIAAHFDATPGHYATLTDEQRANVSDYLGKPLKPRPYNPEAPEFGGMAYDTPTAGEASFARAPDATKLKVLGRARFEAYQRGDATLTDFVQIRDSPIWGKSVTSVGVKRALGEPYPDSPEEGDFRAWSKRFTQLQRAHVGQYEKLSKDGKAAARAWIRDEQLGADVQDVLRYGTVRVRETTSDAVRAKLEGEATRRTAAARKTIAGLDEATRATIREDMTTYRPLGGDVEAWKAKLGVTRIEDAVGATVTDSGFGSWTTQRRGAVTLGGATVDGGDTVQESVQLRRTLHQGDKGFWESSDLGRTVDVDPALAYELSAGTVLTPRGEKLRISRVTVEEDDPIMVGGRTYRNRRYVIDVERAPQKPLLTTNLAQSLDLGPQDAAQDLVAKMLAIGKLNQEIPQSLKDEIAAGSASGMWEAATKRAATDDGYRRPNQVAKLAGGKWRMHVATPGGLYSAPASTEARHAKLMLNAIRHSGVDVAKVGPVDWEWSVDKWGPDNIEDGKGRVAGDCDYDGTPPTITLNARLFRVDPSKTGIPRERWQEVTAVDPAKAGLLQVTGLHEYGHVVDAKLGFLAGNTWNVNGHIHTLSETGTEKPIKDLMDTITHSALVDTHFFSNEDRFGHPLSQKEVDYYTQPREMFARAYAQWTVRHSADNPSTTKAKLAIAQMKGYWSDSDFDPIDQKMTDVLEAGGLWKPKVDKKLGGGLEAAAREVWQQRLTPTEQADLFAIPKVLKSEVMGWVPAQGKQAIEAARQERLGYIVGIVGEDDHGRLTPLDPGSSFRSSRAETDSLRDWNSSNFRDWQKVLRTAGGPDEVLDADALTKDASGLRKIKEDAAAHVDEARVASMGTFKAKIRAYAVMDFQAEHPGPAGESTDDAIARMAKTAHGRAMDAQARYEKIHARWQTLSDMRNLPPEKMASQLKAARFTPETFEALYLRVEAETGRRWKAYEKVRDYDAQTPNRWDVNLAAARMMDNVSIGDWNSLGTRIYSLNRDRTEAVAYEQKKYPDGPGYKGLSPEAIQARIREQVVTAASGWVPDYSDFGKMLRPDNIETANRYLSPNELKAKPFQVATATKARALFDASVSASYGELVEHGHAIETFMKASQAAYEVAEVNRYAPEIGMVDHLMKRSTIPRRSILYRVGGYGDTDDFEATLKPGMEVTSKGYTATTWTPSARGAGVNRDWTWDIVVPAGTRGVYLPGLAGAFYASEQEVLLDRGLKLRIKAIHGKRILAEIVPSKTGGDRVSDGYTYGVVPDPPGG